MANFKTGNEFLETRTVSSGNFMKPTWRLGLIVPTSSKGEVAKSISTVIVSIAVYAVNL